MARTSKAGDSSPMPDVAMARVLMDLANKFEGKTEAANPAVTEFSPGSSIMPVDTVRREMTYVLLESQFDNLVRFNKSSVLCFNVASITFSIFIGAVFGYLYVENPTPFMSWVTLIFSVSSLLATALLGIYGAVYFYQQGSDAQKLKDSTEKKGVSLER